MAAAAIDLGQGRLARTEPQRTRERRSGRSALLCEFLRRGLFCDRPAPCSEATFRHFYPAKPVHRGCFGNLVEALAPYGIEPDSIPTAFNLFMNVPVDVEGHLRVDPPVSKAGDGIALQTEMDLVIGLTACSAYSSNGGTFKPIYYRIN
ncbi:urea carboxylase-associated family protein [Altericroceibacterium spongiae]|uniref:Urea carboxylase-associated family protein n=1 Tax=Altericroceibacterium spongiae TaxID=2320269 RepID=A0A420E9M9_9SPHN|nr:urea carboxylase-associated family protein [Altericroceibacterium spongiae]